jgi:hypothetical protein
MSETNTGTEWIAAFAEAIGAEPPDEATLDQLLDLAGVAAHSSERYAAPLACWLVGRAGLAPAEALDVARRVDPGSPASA